MRADTLRIYKTVHTWTGIVAGLALFIAFYAGALTMFKGPLDRWATPPTVAAAPSPGADELIAQTLAARPDARADFTLHRARHGAPERIAWKARGEERGWSASFAPDGTLRIAPEAPAGLGHFIDVVHRTVALPVDLETGTLVMAIVSALYALAIVSGVVVLWPTLVKDFFALRVGRNLKRMWLDAHNVIGIVSLPFHLVMALSAVVFGMHDLIYDAQKAVVYGEPRFERIWKASGPFSAIRPDPAPAALLPLPALEARVRAQAEGFVPHTLRFRGAGTAGAAVWIAGDMPCCMTRQAQGSFVLASAVDGRLLHTEYLAGQQSGWMASVSAFFALHFGAYGGGTVRWGYFFLGLAGAFLFCSGNLLWVESRRRAERGGASVEQRRSSQWMAAGTVGVSLGCMAALSLTVAAEKWLWAWQGEVLAPWREQVYHAVFLGSVAWAFLRGASRGAVELLWLAAAAALAVPLTSIAGWLLPSSGLWLRADALGVDAIALLGAGAFAWMALRTARRVREGPADSVWAAPAPRPAG